ncbi:hydrogenase formation protein HypD [Candidatus Fermentibacteria bacterium]|nr:hydrogenase formation protein HypD [Candidatus Fermentibacteria bacterium]
MKYLTEFRQASLRDGLVQAISAVARPVRIMEVCGGHTHAICKYGLASLLPPEVRLIHGPGCPVCIVPPGTVAHAVELAQRPGTIVACFGDIMRVPSPRGTLLSLARRDGRVRMVYSAMDALNLARENPGIHVVFLAIGFETTAPSTAVVLRRTRTQAIPNFSVLSAHYLVPPALRALMADPATQVDAFIAPGHVSTIIGLDAYRFLADEKGCPVVATGFEPLDILHAVLMILTQLDRNETAVENQYRRAVRVGGNPAARDAMAEVFTPFDAEWRGLGVIAQSGLAVAQAYAQWDAVALYGAVESNETTDGAGCRCGDVLRGIISPDACGLFAVRCTPDNPCGPCMVSTEGACAAYYRYGLGSRK